MGRIVNIYEAKTNLSKLVERAEAGEEIIIGRNGKAVARIAPLPEKKRRGIVMGVARGQIWMAPDFDELPPDIMAAFEGEGT
ncbi:MAG: type II toxin-antitoxin system Phd/YefM family antitoxin [Alphaproteobacteria bacterium]|nr:type II toxin-antitoxin system Phd/YefM family antitoxin [Alphaproteobacteria bacterium]